jgi:hypothetical protein
MAGSPRTTRCGQAFSLDAQCHFLYIHPAQKRVLITITQDLGEEEKMKAKSVGAKIALIGLVTAVL